MASPRTPINLGNDNIDMIMENLRFARHSPASSPTFEEYSIQWYDDFFAKGDAADDNTGMENGIFTAYGIGF